MIDFKDVKDSQLVGYLDLFSHMTSDKTLPVFLFGLNKPDVMCSSLSFSVSGRQICHFQSLCVSKLFGYWLQLFILLHRHDVIPIKWCLFKIDDQIFFFFFFCISIMFRAN